MIHPLRPHLTAAVVTLAATLTACASHQVTQENSIEGRIAVHATRVVDANKAISDAVKQLADAGAISTAKAAEVVKISVQLDTAALQLADLLKAYDAVAPAPAGQSIEAAQQTRFDQIRQKIAEMGSILTGVLVPIADETTRGKVAALVSALNSALLSLSLELAQGVK